MRTKSSFAIVAIAFAVTVPALAAQPSAASADARWTAWLGCWQQLEETLRDKNPLDADPRDAVPTPGVVVCVTPAADPAGVTLTTIVEKQSALEETVVADGTTRVIDEPGCKGSQRARWSENGMRLFALADLSCTDGSKRTISGLTMMAPGPVWLEIQVVNAEGRESIRVRRYRRAPEQTHVAAQLSRDQLSAAAAAAARQARSLSLEDVKEMNAKVTPSALEAALIETDAQFPLNAKRLQDLDAAGVSDRVLDLMIALSFPNKFVVERRTSSTTLTSIAGDYPLGGYGWYDMGYTLFPYHYAPFGYGMWGRYDTYYYGAPVYAVDGVSDEPQSSGRGRVVDGMGYTRVRSRDPLPSNPRGLSMADGGGGSSSSGGSSSGGSSSGGVSSQGYSGGGGGDSGRTAVPRPPD